MWKSMVGRVCCGILNGNQASFLISADRYLAAIEVVASILWAMEAWAHLGSWSWGDKKSTTDWREIALAE